MQILFLSPAAELGGAERCLIDFIAALRGTTPSHEVSLVSLTDGPLVERAQALGAKVDVVALPRALSELGEAGGLQTVGSLLRRASAAPAFMRFLVELRKALSRQQADVVHSNGMKAHVLAGVATPARSRLVVHLHDFVGSRKTSRLILPRLARVRPRCVFAANSNAVAHDFRRLAPGADIRTVYNVVDLGYFAPGAEEGAWLAGAAGLEPPSQGTVSFGLVATYARWKGHALFIDAARRLLASHPGLPLRFYVVGGPIYDTVGSQVTAVELRRAAQNAGLSGSFGLVPFQDDIARVYRALNVVVHASIEPEPFGRSIVEAMACARPVIVSSAGGAAELFQHGENAWGFSPCDPAALCEAMDQLLNGRLRSKLGGAARIHAAEHFSRDRLAPELLALYRE